MNEDAAVESVLTGQSKTLTLNQRPPTGLQKVDITPGVLFGPISANLTPTEKSRKRSRVAPPGPSTLDEVDEITGTPRTARIAKLFPGGSDVTSKPLKVLIERLIEVTKATLIPKSKATKLVKVDVDSAADILLLTGLIQEQVSLNEARRVVFEPGRQTIPNPSISPASQFDFRVSTISDKLDLVVEQLSKMGASAAASAKPTGQPKGKSYALAASQHAPKAPQQQQSHEARTRAQPPKYAPKHKPDHSITLNQLDPANKAGSEKSIPELIKYFNAQLKACKVKLRPDDPNDVEVRNIHRHPSGDLVLYVDSRGCPKYWPTSPLNRRSTV
ncbi:hypothetical protein DFH28DRAFT_885302 [Melampsora americana]|nr:hypothetical protein DFH28DRAFT_885302 [Melampsora americana]